MKRLLPPRLFLLALAAMGLLAWLLPGPRLLGWPWQVAGVVPMLTGATLTLGGSRLFSQRGTNIKTFDEPGMLVTDGMFGFSRNPMYLGFVLFLVGVAATIGATTPFAVAAAFFVVTDRWYIRFEEAWMRSKFGAAYEDYAASTRRWI